MESEEERGVAEQVPSLRIPPPGEASLEAAGNQTAPEAAAESARRRPLRMAILLAVAIAGAIVGFIVARGLPAQLPLARWLYPESAAERLSGKFWRQIFDRQRDTFLVPTDGGLVLLHNFLQKPVTLSSYINDSYRSEDQIGGGPRVRFEVNQFARYCVAGPEGSKAVWEALHQQHRRGPISQIYRQPEVVPERLMIRYTRDLRMRSPEDRQRHPHWIDGFQSLG